jgi:hypothetical protein
VIGLIELLAQGMVCPRGSGLEQRGTDMTSRRLIGLAIVLGLVALPLLVIAASLDERGGSLGRDPADRTPLILAQDQTSCFCPDLPCDNGTSPGCLVSCEPPKQAQCRCEAMCDLYGNPSGSNRCECAEE